MSRTLLSVDLDWLNGANDPIDKRKELLSHVPKNVPAIMTVEHHEFLSPLRRWIRSGKIKTPFNVINVDEHHDYYFNNPPFDPFGNGVNCGVWGYRLQLDWYERYTWVHNKQPEFSGWDEAQDWLTNVGIPSSVRSHHRLGELRSDIVAAVFCVSPDYLDFEMWDVIHEVVEVVVQHFGLKIAPLKIKNGVVSAVDGWRMAPRPLKVR